MSEPEILIVAGEASGDAHAARVVRELRRLHGGLRFFGTGGDRLREAGVELLFHASVMNVVGFLEVARRYRHLRSIFRHVVESAASRRPLFAVLVDYPGFNLRLAAELGRLKIPVVYYIAPQVWAWKEGRVRALAEHVDSLIVAFPFEVEYFRARGVESRFFGHPLVDTFAELGIAPFDRAVVHNPPVIAYLPGSRPDEIRHHMPVVREVMRELGEGYRHVIQRAPTVSEESLREHAGDLRFEIVSRPYQALSTADAALVKSGTSTIEATLLGAPYAVFYRTSPLSYHIAKRLIKVDSIAMANILAGRPIVREFVQSGLDVKEVAAELRRLAEPSAYRDRIKADLLEVSTQLGAPGAAGEAARFISERYL